MSQLGHSRRFGRRWTTSGTPINGHRQTAPAGPFSADIAKVENRSVPKISRAGISGPFRCCIAFQLNWGGPWLILDETIWSLKSPRVKRVSSFKNFRSPSQKDFCNNICQKRKSSGYFGHPRAFERLVIVVQVLVMRAT